MSGSLECLARGRGRTVRNTDWELEELPSGVSIGAGVRGMSRGVVREEGAQEMAWQRLRGVMVY